jgi:hypothetical protein
MVTNDGGGIGGGGIGGGIDGNQRWRWYWWRR